MTIIDDNENCNDQQVKEDNDNANAKDRCCVDDDNKHCDDL